jgi:nitroreductase/dihydropteridine reductase
MENLQEALQWRYATKRMTGEKIDSNLIEEIINAAQMAPTSLGLQPFQIIHLKSDEIKNKIHTSACKQPQVLECDSLLLFAAWNKNFDSKINSYISLISKTRNVSEESLIDFKNGILKFTHAKNENELYHWASKSAYIALGFALLSAAMLGVDTTPMEGFDNAKMDEVLELNVLGLQSSVMMAIGKRDVEKCYLVNAAKVRRSLNDLIIEM